MTKRKQNSDSRKIDLVREARAGIIFASDALEAEKRARIRDTERMIRRTKFYLGSIALASDELAISSILAELRHYCDCRQLEFGKLETAAYELYVEDADIF